MTHKINPSMYDERFYISVKVSTKKSKRLLLSANHNYNNVESCGTNGRRNRTRLLVQHELEIYNVFARKIFPISNSDCLGERNAGNFFVYQHINYDDGTQKNDRNHALY